MSEGASQPLTVVVNDDPTQLEILCGLALKAGLGADDWMSGAEFCVFEAQVFREADEPNVGDIDGDAG